MEKTLDAKKQDKVEALAEDAKESASEGYNTENQLSNNLISVTLAFVALLATAISTSNVLSAISIEQKVLIMASIVIFSISIFVGLVNYYLNMRFHQKSAKTSRKKADRADDAESGVELKAVKQTSATVRPQGATKRNNAMIVIQIVLLMIGLVLCVAFIGTMLFETSKVAK